MLWHLRGVTLRIPYEIRPTIVAVKYRDRQYVVTFTVGQQIKYILFAAAPHPPHVTCQTTPRYVDVVSIIKLSVCTGF